MVGIHFFYTFFCLVVRPFKSKWENFKLILSNTLILGILVTCGFLYDDLLGLDEETKYYKVGTALIYLFSVLIGTTMLISVGEGLVSFGKKIKSCCSKKKEEPKMNKVS